MNSDLDNDFLEKKLLLLLLYKTRKRGKAYMYIYVYSNWKYSWKHLTQGTYKKYIFLTSMKSFVHFLQTYIYKSIWNTYEIRIFRTMGAWLETSTKCKNSKNSGNS